MFGRSQVFGSSTVFGSSNVMGRGEIMGQPGSDFAPTDLSGLQLWLDAGTATKALNFVTSWTDLSGNGRHAATADATHKPLAGQTTQNGFDVISNNDPAEGVPNAAADTLDFSNITLTDWDIFMVGKVLDATVDSYGLGRNDANNQPLRFDGPNAKLTTYDGVRSCSTSVALPVALTSYAVHEVARNSSQVVQFYQNGAAVTTAVDFGAAQASMVANSLWQISGLTTTGQAFWLAVLIYNRALTTPERNQVVAYLRNRFAV